MGTIGTKRLSTATVLSGQAKTFKRADAAGYVLTGPAINANTSVALSIPQTGSASTITSISVGPIITGITYLDTNNQPASATAINSLGGNLRITGQNFSPSDLVYLNNSAVTTVYVDQNTIIANAPAISGTVGNLIVGVFTTSNVGGIGSTLVRYSRAPTWITSGAFSVYNNLAANIALSVTSDSALTYSLQGGSGNLPTGLTLSGAGFISGTATGYATNTVFNFVVVVTDAENQTAQQSFSLTVLNGEPYFSQTSLLLVNNPTATVFSDASSQNTALTRVGDVRPSRLSPFWPGGYSVYFDGVTDYISSTGAQYILGTNDFTIEGWVYYSQPTANATRFFWCNYNTWAAQSIFIGKNTGNSGLFTVYVNNFSGSAILIDPTLPRFGWMHYAVTRNGSTFRLFRDGTIVATYTNTGSVTTSNVSQVGGNTEASGAMLGYISNFRIINGTALYTANFTPSTDQLNSIANVALLTCRSGSLIDESPVAATLTRNGDIRIVPFSPWNDRPQTITNSSFGINFDGTGDYLSANVAAGNFGSNDFTVEAWVFFANVTMGYQPIITNTGSADGQGWSLIMDTTNTLSVYLSISNSLFDNRLTTSFTPVVRNWTHIAVARSGLTVTLYANGVSINSTYLMTPALASATQNLFIGYYPYFPVVGARSFTGMISNLRIVNGRNLYPTNFTVPTAPLTAVANTTLLTGHTSTIVDGSTNNYAITVFGDTRVVSANPFGDTITTISNYSYSPALYSGSAYFDGTGDNLSAPTSTAFGLGTGNFTVEFWVYPTANPANGPGTIVDLRTGATSTACTVRINSSLQLIFYNGPANVESAFTGGTVILNAWSHVAYVRVGNTVFGYINGIQVGSVAVTSDLGTTQPILIGQNQTAGYNFNGYISNFRLIKGTALYTTSFVVPKQPLTSTAATSLLTFQNDTSNTTYQFNDESPYQPLITRTGDCSQGPFNPSIPSGWSVVFDVGAPIDHLTVPHHTSLNLSSGDFTIEGYIYWTATSAGIQQIVNKDGVINVSYPSYAVAINSSGNLILNLGNGAGLSPTVTTYTGSAVTRNTWTHFACVKTGTTIRIYQNGIQTVSTSQGIAITDGGKAVYIGTYNGAGGDDSFVGHISNLRIIKGTALYTANFTPSTSTLTTVANTSLLACATPTLTDEGLFNHPITRVNDVRVTAFGPFAPHTVTPIAYSAYFDGNGDYIRAPYSSLFDLTTSPFTIETWLYLNALPTSNNWTFENQWQVICSVGTVDLYDGWQFRIGLSEIAFGGNNNTTAIQVEHGISIGQWYHFAVTRDSTNTYRMWRNGVLIGTAVSSSNPGTGAFFWIGTETASWAYLNGYLSNLRIVKNVVYTSNFTPPTGALTAVSGTSLLTFHRNYIVDGSPNNVVLTGFGQTTVRTWNPLGYTTTMGVLYDPSTHGGSMFLDGSGDFINVSTVDQAAFLTTDFTVEFWIYPFAYGGTVVGGQIVGTTNGAASGWSICQGQDINTFRLITNASGTWTDALSAGTGNGPTLYCWTHYALNRQGATLTLFKNGVAVVSRTDASAWSFSGTNTILGRFFEGTNTRDFNGYISNVRLYKGSSKYNAGFYPPIRDNNINRLDANVSLQLNFTNTAMYDSTGRSSLVTVNDPHVNLAVKKYGSGSIYFDGTGDSVYVPGNTWDYYTFYTGDFTIEFWMYTSNAAQTALIYDQRPNGVNGAYPAIYMQSSTFKYYANTADQITGGTPVANTWMHIAVSRSGTSTRMFLNGTQVGSTYTDSTNYLCGTNRPVIGISGFDSLVPYQGYIDDLRVTRGFARYTGNFTPPTDTHPIL